eukprot:445053-Rhodomonas_salina.4
MFFPLHHTLLRDVLIVSLFTVQQSAFSQILSTRSMCGGPMNPPRVLQLERKLRRGPQVFPSL